MVEAIYCGEILDGLRSIRTLERSGHRRPLPGYVDLHVAPGALASIDVFVLRRGVRDGYGREKEATHD